ncbi:MAG: nitrilase-related carbon-nitrogen hydrolase, partial [Rhizobiaceae bacterium]
AADFIVEHMIRVRAFESQVHVAYINNAGTSGDYTFAGRSQIAAPDGSVLAEASVDEEMLIYAVIDRLEYLHASHANTYLTDLKPA